MTTCWTRLRHTAFCIVWLQCDHLVYIEAEENGGGLNDPQPSSNYGSIRQILKCVIAGFRCVYEWDLRSSGTLLSVDIDVSTYNIVPIYKVQAVHSLVVSYRSFISETSVTKYGFTLSNVPEERKYQILRSFERTCVNVWLYSPDKLEDLGWLYLETGYALAQVVEALCYKPDGRGFDSRWRHWNFSLT
jgi:hypothetical protein